MGAELIAVATMKWAYVSHRAFRVLTRMALTALDKPKDGKPPNRYFAGHDVLAAVLGCEEGTSEATKLRYVREAIAELVQCGAIVLEQAAASGGNARYELTLDAVPMPAKPRRKRSSGSKRRYGQQGDGPPTGVLHGPPTGQGDGPPTEEGDGPPTPYKEEELLEETLEELLEEGIGRASGPPALRVIAGTDRLTPKFVQPSIWPIAVPDPISTDVSTAQTPGQLARAQLRLTLAERKRGRKTG